MSPENDEIAREMDFNRYREEKSVHIRYLVVVGTVVLCYTMQKG